MRSFTSRRGLVISCGMNPNYGEFDTYHMAACAIDEGSDEAGFAVHAAKAFSGNSCPPEGTAGRG